MENSNIFPKHGGYRNLLSYQKAVIIYDGTVFFCNKYFDKYDRTVDQMVQAARSGKQNIVEASVASATSKKSEIFLTNVARASLEELLTDYEDFLRIRKLQKWSREHPYSKRFDELNRTPNPTYETFKKAIEHPDPEINANILICLIGVATYLLWRQLQHLEKEFIEKGGLTEKMYHARKNRKK